MLKRKHCLVIDNMHSYKNNYHSEGIHVANAQTKVIIFCKSHPLNWQLEDNNQQRAKKSKIKQV